MQKRGSAEALLKDSQMISLFGDLRSTFKVKTGFTENTVNLLRGD